MPGTYCISSNDIRSHVTESLAAATKSELRLQDRGSIHTRPSESLLAQGAVPRTHFNMLRGLSFPLLALGTSVKNKAHVGSTRTNMGFQHPGVSRPAQPGPHKVTSGLPFALLCHVSPCRASYVTIVYYLLSPGTIFGAAHKMDRFFLSPASLGWQLSRSPLHPLPSSLHLPTTPEALNRPPRGAAADPFEEAVSGRGGRR